MAWSRDELPQTLERAMTIARGAGDVLMRHFRHLGSVDEKGPGDLVTVAGRSAEAYILQALRETFPGHDVLGEETGSHVADGDDERPCWFVDPLDGTTNYAHGLSNFAVSLGLSWRDDLVLGVVYNPAHDEMYSGAQGLGAALNGVSLKVSDTRTLDRSLLVTGFAYDRRNIRDNNYAEFCHFTHCTHGVRRFGAAALDLAYVAAGRVDGFWEHSLSPWDIAAGIVLVREAGGVVTAYDGSPVHLDDGRLIASNGKIHAAIGEGLASVERGERIFELR